MDKDIKQIAEEAMERAFQLGRLQGFLEAAKSNRLLDHVADKILPISTGACGDVIWSIKLPAVAEKPDHRQFIDAVIASISSQILSDKGLH